MLYHRDVYLPEWIQSKVKQQGKIRLIWTNHADDARHNDKRGIIPKLNTIDLSACEVIEVEFCGTVKKVLYRANFDHRDLVIALIPRYNDTHVVKTVWWQHKDDVHSTLQEDKYVQFPAKIPIV